MIDVQGWVSRLASLCLLTLAACADSGGSGSDGGGDGDSADVVGDVEADSPQEPPCGTERARDDLGIPTLDGYELSAFLDRPAQADCPLPTVLIQTPYDKESAWRGFFGDERPDRPLFDSPFYNYVVVDWRGRFGSSDLPNAGQGAWLAQDSYDTVEWIAEQSWSDGVVGMWGVSALCGAQFRTAAGPEPSATNPDFADGPAPHLAAMVPIFCSPRLTYELVYPGGALRHEYATTIDVLGFGLRTLYENNPRQNVLWDIVEGANPVERITIPALVVAGWWDLLPNGSIASYQELVAGSDPSVRDQHRLLIGPWIHFAVGGATSEGAVRPLSDEERVYMDFARESDSRALAFFDHHLRGVDNDVPSWPRVRYHQANEGWRVSDDWPPAGVAARTLYLTQAGGLDESAPRHGSMTIESDPSDPSPTVGGPTLAPYNCVNAEAPLVCSLVPDDDLLLIHGPTSQAAVLERDDALLFATAPLDEPLALLGAIRVFVDMATSGADADVAIRIVDMAEDGDPLLIADGIQRLAARDGVRTYSEVASDTRYSLEVPLLKDFAYTLPAGHRLGVIVSAANWPLFARNPQDGAVFLAADVTAGTSETFGYGLPATEVDLQGDGVAATHTIYLDGATRIEISVAP